MTSAHSRGQNARQDVFHTGRPNRWRRLQADDRFVLRDARVPDRVPAFAPAAELWRRGKGCEAARAGEISAEAARDALITFAVTAGILWPAAQPAVSVKPVVRGLGGYAA
ncbi:DUF982 domain-containing protein [Mesorhizobium sp. M0189]|uniref:hypothetical protein n=1 Tax=unclassified Mesorhizobium TaxID=325217 RepID=UPI003334CC22